MQRVGSRRQVWNKTAKQTSGDSLVRNSFKTNMETLNQEEPVKKQKEIKI